MRKEKPIIVVWFSCGAASAVAAKKTIEMYGKYHEIVVVNNPIANEDADNRRFLKDVEKWLGVEIQLAINPKYPDADCETVWDDRKYMSGVAGAPCTMELKKAARQEWEKNNNHLFLVLGFTVEEKNRAERFIKFERNNLVTPLIDLQITKKDCYEIIMDAGIELPNIYKMGYPNANCIGCVKSSSPTYWNHVRLMHPEIFLSRAIQSRNIGCRLIEIHPKYVPDLFYRDYKGEYIDIETGQLLHYTDKKSKRRLKTPRIFLDQLPLDVKPSTMKNLDFECGIFCEEKL